MPDGPGRFTQNYSCSALLRIPLRPLMLRIRDCHPLRLNFPEHSPHTRGTTAWSYNPRRALKRSGFGLLPVRSPLLGESLSYFLFLLITSFIASVSQGIRHAPFITFHSCGMQKNTWPYGHAACPCSYFQLYLEIYALASQRRGKKLIYLQSCLCQHVKERYHKCNVVDGAT